MDNPRRGTVLVVEDRDDVRQGMAQLLELNGFHVEDARDVEEALGRLHEEPNRFALILLDLLLGHGLSGWDFRMRQLADPALADIPTVAVTVIDIDDQKRASLRIDDWLEKPFRCAELMDLVKRYVVPDGTPLHTGP